ncbi:MAG: cbb3-type cytochrome c oxidase subunit I, partial [Deltaproteobacteria bacterium]|nr:cbb3-type cytochrome c oxidase subunit I [Deltaproteobacteria bacterium]
RLNQLSYQIFLVSCIVLVASFFMPGGAAAGAWTAYPPLNASKGIIDGQVEYYNMGYDGNPIIWGGHMWILAVALEFVSFLLGGINFITTTLNMRTKGLGLWQLPMSIWMINIASIVFALSVGPLVAGAIMMLFDRMFGTGFYNPSTDGDPILFQHLFWFFGHPEVYVVLLPALGFFADIIPVFSRKPLFGYKVTLYFTIFLGALSFIVWAHHQFQAGIDPRMAEFFTITTIIISIPFGVMLFSLIFSLYGGSITFEVPMLWAIAGIGEFLVGGVTGIHLGTSSSDIYFHDNYFVVAHFHYTLFPATFFGGFAAITFWFPKWFGRMMNPGLGKLHFWLTTISFNTLFIPLFKLGFMGQHRRIYNYEPFSLVNTPEAHDLRVIATVSLLVLLASQLIFLFNFFKSWASGEKAGNNPWKSNTLEWTTVSPPPHGNFDKPITVYRGPYEYSVPGRKDDSFPQNVQG